MKQCTEVKKVSREDLQKADPEVAVAVMEQILNLQKDFTQNMKKILKTYEAECVLLDVTVINVIGIAEPVLGSDKLMVQSAFMGGGKNLVKLSTEITKRITEAVQND